MIMNDAPWSFLYQPNYVVAMRSNVKGYTYFPADTLHPLPLPVEVERQLSRLR